MPVIGLTYQDVARAVRLYWENTCSRLLSIDKILHTVVLARKKHPEPLSFTILSQLELRQAFRSSDQFVAYLAPYREGDFYKQCAEKAHERAKHCK